MFRVPLLFFYLATFTKICMYIHRGYVVVDRISVSKNAILENVFPNISPVDPQDPHHTNPSFHVVVRVLFPLTLRVIIYPLIYTHTHIHIHIHIHIIYIQI